MIHARSTVPDMVDKDGRVIFDIGSTAHTHTEQGVIRGTVVAMGRYAVLFDSGREWMRRRVHPGKDC